MKDVKEDIRGSVFPVRLFSSYVLLLIFLSGIFDGPLAFFFCLGFPYPEDYAESYANMLALSPALLVVGFLAMWNFRSMPIFATFSVFMALWLIWVIRDAYWPGFATDFPHTFEPLGLLCASLVVASPFVIIYLIWRFWPRKQAEGLPAA